MKTLTETWATLLETVSFTARAHLGQLRKDKRTPYVAHVFRVCLILRHIFEIDDSEMLMAALLHDSIEDTTTDFDDLLELLPEDNQRTAAWVAALSKDSRKPEQEREEEYRTIIAQAPAEVKLCKLADLFDNTLDIRHFPPDQRMKTLNKTNTVLNTIQQSGLTPEEVPKYQQCFERACSLVEQLLTEIRSQS